MNQTANPAPKSPAVQPGQIRIAKSLLQRATQSDPEALEDIFSQFLPADEKVVYAEYFGVEGIWGIGKKSFCCLTDRRVASLKVGAFKEVIYNDGYLEHINSGVIYQPSKLLLYVMLVVATSVALWLGGLISNLFFHLVAGEQGEPSVVGMIVVGLLVAALLNFLFWLISARIFYRFSKCGLVWWIRQGVMVYIFSNRNRLTRANHIYRLCADMRDQRVKSIREMA